MQDHCGRQDHRDGSRRIGEKGARKAVGGQGESRVIACNVLALLINWAWCDQNGQAISTLQELDQHCRQLDLQVDMTAKEIRDLIDEVFKVCSVKTDRSEDTGQTRYVGGTTFQLEKIEADTVKNRYYFPFKEKGAMFPDALPGNQGEVALPFPPWAPADVPNDEMTGDETAVDDLLGNELLGNDSPGNGMPADNMDVDDQNGGKDDGKDVGKDDDINKTDDDETDADEPNDDTNKSTTTTDGSRTSDTDSDEELDAPTFRDGSYVSESEDEEEQQFVIDDNLNAPRTNEDPLYDWDQAVLEYTDAGLKLVKILPFHLRDQIKVRDFCERLLAAPQPFGRDATSIQEMMYATSFFRAIHLDIQSSSIDWRIPGSVQSSHILLPVQVIWELRRAFFFHRCRNLAVQQRATFETVIDGWRSTYPSSLPPDSFRIKLWQHVHPSNGLLRDVHYWTIHRLKTLTHTLQRETEAFQEKMAERVWFYKAVSEAFGVEL